MIMMDHDQDGAVLICYVLILRVEFHKVKVPHKYLHVRIFFSLLPLMSLG